MHAHTLIAAVLWDGVEFLLERPCEGGEAEYEHGYALLRAVALVEGGRRAWVSEYDVRCDVRHTDRLSLPSPCPAAPSNAGRSASKIRARLGRSWRRDCARYVHVSRFQW